MNHAARSLGTAVALLFLQAGASAQIIHTATHAGHTYHLTTPKVWTAAQAEATGLGGDLVTIDDAAENAWVHATFGPIALSYASANNLTGGVSLRTGFTDQASEGSFTWISGAPITYTNWAPGEPGGNFADEDYAGILVTFAPQGRWHDIVADTRFNDVTFGVVEVAAVPKPATLGLFGIALGGADA